MNWDELEPKKPAAGAQLGEPLETLSIAELEARLTALEAELGRTPNAKELAAELGMTLADLQATEQEASAKTIFSLGGVCPAPPSTCRGKMWKPTAAAAAAFRKERRFMVDPPRQAGTSNWQAGTKSS